MSANVKTVFGPSHGHVQSFRHRHETNVIALIFPNARDDYQVFFLTLEAVHRIDRNAAEVFTTVEPGTNNTQFNQIFRPKTNRWWRKKNIPANFSLKEFLLFPVKRDDADTFLRHRTVEDYGL